MLELKHKLATTLAELKYRATNILIEIVYILSGFLDSIFKTNSRLKTKHDSYIYRISKILALVKLYKFGQFF